jgi:hypothetical protein
VKKQGRLLARSLPFRDEQGTYIAPEVMTNDKLVADLRKRFEGYTNKGGLRWARLVTILRPMVQLGIGDGLRPISYCRC